MKILSFLKKNVFNWEKASDKKEIAVSSDAFSSVKHPIPTTVR